MKNILIYYPANKRSVVIETIASEVMNAGYNVIVLTIAERGEIHDQLDKLGIQNYHKTYKGNSIIIYLKHVFYLRSFCKRYKIDTIWSHLQSCNLIAVLAQFLLKCKVVVFRHHFHASIKVSGFKSVNRNEVRIGKIISRLAKEIVVPSSEVYNGMVNYEKVNPSKLSIVPYIYDFERYNKPDKKTVQEIKEKYNAKLLIVIASRMISMKRHILVLPVIQKLIREGLDIKVLLLDEGEERVNLEKYVHHNNLNDKVFFLGFQSNIIDYLASADILVHPSYTEASSSLVKEFALNKKPVIVCSGVGDFDEYIVHKDNSFLVRPGNEAEQFEEYIREVYHNSQLITEMGTRLHDIVFKLFSTNPNTISLYISKV